MNGETKHLSLKDVMQFVTEKIDLLRVPVYVLLPNNSLLPVTAITLTATGKEVYIHAGKEEANG